MNSTRAFGSFRSCADGGRGASNTLRNDARDHRRRELGGCRQQPVAVRAHPFAFFVELADDARTHVVAPVVELLLQLVFDDLPLFLDDEDLVKPFGEMADALGLERPRHRDLVHAHADLRGVGFGDAEIVQRLAHVEIALAAGDDAEPRLGRIDDDPVQLVRRGNSGAPRRPCSPASVLRSRGSRRASGSTRRRCGSGKSSGTMILTRVRVDRTPTPSSRPCPTRT